MEFCAGHSLSGELATCVETPLPRTAFLRLLQTDLRLFDALKKDGLDEVTPALVRGNTAKIEIIGKSTRYMALLDKESEGAWCLEAFLPLCKVCGGAGRNQEHTAFCPSCGGLKWGAPGDLRYCFNNAPGWWKLVEEQDYFLVHQFMQKGM